MTPFISSDTNDSPDAHAAEPSKPNETRLPWAPTAGAASDILATFDTMSRRLGDLLDEGEPDDDGARAA